MGIASLVLSIVSLVLGFVPFVWLIAIIPAIVGLILGIISLVKKKQKGQSIAGIVISAITIILLIFTFVNLFKTIGEIGGKAFTDSFSSSENEILGDSFLNQEKNNVDKLKENVIVEKIGVTARGDFVFKIKNNNNEPVYIDSVNVVFKDADGNFVVKEDGYVSYFAIPANSEAINYVWSIGDDFAQYPNYEFEVVMSEYRTEDDMLCDNFEITSNNTGEQIAVEVKNNNNEATRSMNIVVAYYQGENVVGIENGDAYEATAAGGTAYVNVDYPVDSDYDEISFDRYEVYFLGADKDF